MTSLRVDDFDFHLPQELIAQQPPAVRGHSRMLVLDRATGALGDDSFANLQQHLRPGDLLVLNDSRVIPARLYAHRTLRREREKPTGKIEVMLTEPVRPNFESTSPTVMADLRFCDPFSPSTMGVPHVSILRHGNPEMQTDASDRSQPQTGGALPSRPNPGARVGNLNPQPTTDNLWRALVRPGRKVAIGEILVFPDSSGKILLQAEVIDRGEFGERILRFALVGSFSEIPDEGGFFSILDSIGHMPLPPYIHRDDANEDRERYQTVFAQERGSVAAPTAGLHFTPQLLDALTAMGVEIARVTLHVGLGTFASLRVENVEDVRLHKERYTLSAETANALNRAVLDRKRIVAVGTTSVRTLESVAAKFAPGQLQPHSDETDIFISPGYQFRLVNAFLTNFHLPQSSLLMLVSAFAGRENVLAAYSHAVQENYRFFSYGDCMFIA